MKVTNLQLPVQLLLRWLPNDKTSTNIVTLCEDFDSAARAKDFCGQLAAALRPRTVIVDSVWSFDLLNHSDGYQFADSDVSGADIIIVSAHGNSRLRAHARSWLENLIRARNGKPGALIGLLAQEKVSSDPAMSVGCQLRNLADAARLDYFYTTDDTWNANLNLSLTPCLADSGNEPIRDPRASDNYIYCQPSVTYAHSTPPPWPLSSMSEPVPAPRNNSHCPPPNQHSRHLPANGASHNLLDAGRIGIRSNRGRPTVNRRGSEVQVKLPAGELAESIAPEFALEAA